MEQCIRRSVGCNAWHSDVVNSHQIKEKAAGMFSIERTKGARGARASRSNDETKKLHNGSTVEAV